MIQQKEDRCRDFVSACRNFIIWFKNKPIQKEEGQELHTYKVGVLSLLTNIPRNFP